MVFRLGKALCRLCPMLMGRSP